MILFTSSKGQDFTTCPVFLTPTEPPFQQKAGELNRLLTSLSPAALKKLMGISDALCEETLQKILTFSTTTGKPALFAFNGEAYKSLQAETLTPEAHIFAKQHFCILSGMYGVLRPTDLIVPYRLEMGYKLANEAGPNLYPFWKQSLTRYLNAALKENQSPHLINLASVEYSKVVDKKSLICPFIEIQFKEEDDGQLKSVAIYAKRARGMMARYLLSHQTTALADLTQFQEGGYSYRPELSQKNLLLFTRPKP